RIACRMSGPWSPCWSGICGGGPCNSAIFARQGGDSACLSALLRCRKSHPRLLGWPSEQGRLLGWQKKRLCVRCAPISEQDVALARPQGALCARRGARLLANFRRDQRKEYPFHGAK